MMKLLANIHVHWLEMPSCFWAKAWAFCIRLLLIQGVLYSFAGRSVFVCTHISNRIIIMCLLLHSYNYSKKNTKAQKCWYLNDGMSLVHMHSWMHYHTACIYSMHTSNSSNQCSQVFVYSSRTVTMYTQNTSSASMSSSFDAIVSLSRNFTRVAIYLVVQMDLSRWRAVHCGQLTFYWSLNRWHQQSRLAITPLTTVHV